MGISPEVAGAIVRHRLANRLPWEIAHQQLRIDLTVELARRGVCVYAHKVRLVRNGQGRYELVKVE